MHSKIRDVRQPFETDTHYLFRANIFALKIRDTMIRHILHIALLVLPLAINAQETKTEFAVDDIMYQTQESPAQAITPQFCDSVSLHLPTLTEYGQVPNLHFPYIGWHNWPTWRLHEGVNASLGLSVFSTFGSGHTWSGAGFSENASLMYAMPLGKKFSAAIGGYIKNTSWAHDSFRSAGLSAILNYQANDRLNVYAYGQKSLLNSNHIPLPLYYMDDVADRIGIGAEYKVTPAFSIGLSVDYSRYKDPNPWFDHYNANIKQQNREFPR